MLLKHILCMCLAFSGIDLRTSKLVEEELSQLKAQGIIEETYSLWASQAFDINKKAEQIH